MNSKYRGRIGDEIAGFTVLRTSQRSIFMLGFGRSLLFRLKNLGLERKL